MPKAVTPQQEQEQGGQALADAGRVVAVLVHGDGTAAAQS